MSLNSLPAHDFSKLSLIEVYNTHHNLDMICLSETNLDSSYIQMMTHDVTYFTLIRADNPHNCKRGGVSIYFKKHLAVRPVSLLNLNECRMLEISIQNKKGHAISLHQSPSQSNQFLRSKCSQSDQSDQFLRNFKQFISDRMSRNPHFTLATGEFNV